MDLIKRTILEGLLKDIRVAERSFLLSKKIGSLWPDKPRDTKASISKILYNLAYTDMVLGIARIYDQPDKKYPTRSIYRLYQIIEEQNFDVPLNSKKDLLDSLTNFGFNPQETLLLADSEIRDFNRRALEFLKFREYNDPLSSQLNQVKTIRDKVLAHNEDVEVDTFIKYDSIQSLLDHSKNVVSFFLFAYCGIRLKAGKDFYLSFNAHEWSTAYENFLGLGP